MEQERGDEVHLRRRLRILVLCSPLLLAVFVDSEPVFLPVEVRKKTEESRVLSSPLAQKKKVKIFSLAFAVRVAFSQRNQQKKRKN